MIPLISAVPQEPLRHLSSVKNFSSKHKIVTPQTEKLEPVNEWLSKKNSKQLNYWVYGRKHRDSERYMNYFKNAKSGSNEDLVSIISSKRMSIEKL